MNLLDLCSDLVLKSVYLSSKFNSMCSVLRQFISLFYQLQIYWIKVGFALFSVYPFVMCKLAVLKRMLMVETC